MAFPWLATIRAGRVLLRPEQGLLTLPLLGQDPQRNGTPPAPVARELFWLVLVLSAVALLGVVLLYTITRWRRQSARGRAATSDQLSEFRALYEDGQMSPEEFARVRALLGARIKGEVAARPTPAAPKETTAEQKKPAQPDPPAPESNQGPNPV